MISLTISFLLVTSVLSNPVPLEYDITIIPNIDSLTFISETKITLEVQESISNFTLNSRYLDITGVNAVDATGTEVGVTYDVLSESESVDLLFENELSEGLIEVTLQASGNISSQDHEGLYIWTYTITGSGNLMTTRSILLTDFRYDKARQVFPSVDDPAYPSTFTLRIVRSNDYLAVSNMAKTSSINYDDDNSLDTFARTDPIPTYLLGFTIGHFVEDPGSSTSIYSLSGESISHLRQLSTTAIQLFQELYPYRLNKLHQVVLPDDCLSSDVLEHIGLIIYKESTVLYNETRESSEDKQEIAKAVTHAIVKQWYKDSPSFAWRPTYWTSEGISTTYEYEVLQVLEPSLRLQEQFLTEELVDAFKSDVGSGAISLELAPGQNAEIFSKLHATKSYSLVRMISHLPIPGNILEDESNPLLVSWSQTIGYPSVKVTKNAGDFTFVQDQVLPVPINIAFDNQLPLELTLETKDLRLQYNESAAANWYLVNPDRYGYYRANYGDRNWRALSLFLRNPSSDINDISPLNRAVLIDEAFYSVQQSRLNISLYLELSLYLERERDYIPLNAFIKTANELRSLLFNTPAQAKFEFFAVNLLQNLYDEIGTTLAPSDDHSQILIRSKVLTWLCNFGHSRCRQEMNAILSRLEGVHPDLQDLVYCGGTHLGDIATRSFLLTQHNIHGKKRIVKSIACSSDEALLWSYITAVVDESLVMSLREEDKVDAFLAVVEGNDVAVNLALTFAKQYLEVLLQRFAEDEISQMFIALSKKLVSVEHEQTIEAIIECLTEDQKVQYEQLFITVTDTILANRRWQEANALVVEKWLDANMPLVNSTTTTSTAIPGIITTTTSTTTTTTTTTTPQPSGDGSLGLETSTALMVLLGMPLFLFYN